VKEQKIEFKLFVSNLALDVTSEQLQNLFENYGEVLSTRVVVDQYTGRGRGHAFVEMASEEEMELAQKELNGQEFFGQILLVFLELLERQLAALERVVDQVDLSHGLAVSVADLCHADRLQAELVNNLLRYYRRCGAGVPNPFELPEGGGLVALYR